MATETFTWRVQAQPSPTRNYKTRDIQFGDGYVQSAAEGLNAVTESLSIVWKGTYAEAVEVMNFFNRHGGYKSFFWTNPIGELNLYRCKDAAPQDLGGDVFQVTGTFERRYSS